MKQRMYTRRLNPTKVPGGIMIVGINPSIHSKFESAWDDNFGRNITEFLEETSIHKEEIWLTNLYKCPTENNRMLLPSEVEKGWRELEKEIKECNPKCIIAMGRQVIEKFEGKAYEKSQYSNGDAFYTVYCIPHVQYFKWIKSAVLRKKAIDLLKQIKRK